ncbi:MAG: DUF4363 family protein [Ruminococcaceae bacterium]|nr:DUF4363 family protein [Oscillospiraceae bacterium]
MNRYWYGLIGLTILIVTIGGGMWYVCNVTEHMEIFITEAEQQLLRENHEEALRLISNSQRYWEEKNNKLDMILDHGAVEQVDVALVEAATFIQFENKEHGVACCQAVLKNLRALRDGQQPGFYNLF